MNHGAWQGQVRVLGRNNDVHGWGAGRFGRKKKIARKCRHFREGQIMGHRWDGLLPLENGQWESGNPGRERWATTRDDSDRLLLYCFWSHLPLLSASVGGQQNVRSHVTEKFPSSDVCIRKARSRQKRKPFRRKAGQKAAMSFTAKGTA